MKVDITQAIDYMKMCIKASLPCMLEGSPGIGKSEISHALGRYFKLKIIDIRLSQCDPTELSGFPFMQDGKADYIPMSMWPTEHDPIPAGYKGFLIILDEFNSASMAVQAASYKVILDRYVGQVKLHPNTAIICIGNLATDNAIVNRLSTAMQSRLIHLELDVIPSIWLENWAIQNGIDHRITAYIDERPENLYNFDPNHNDKTFANPRTWYFASKLIKNIPGDLSGVLPLLAGTIGEGVAREFVLHVEQFNNIPRMSEILAHPGTANLSREPSMLYGAAHYIANNITAANMPKLMIYIERMPIEFQTITLQNAIRKDKKVFAYPEVKKWIREKGAELF